jgi:ferritin-like metal-binding protein YciE
MRTFLIHKQKPFQTMQTISRNERLRHHCNKAIERGDGPIAGIPAEIEILRADRSEYNESNGKDMAGCIAKAGSVIAYFPTQSALRSAPLYAAAPDLLDALISLEKASRKVLDTSATHDGLENCKTLLMARIAIEKAQAEGNK